MHSLIKFFCAAGLLSAHGVCPARADTAPPALADLAAKVLPSVVSIASTDPVTGNGGGDDGNDDNNNANPNDPNDGGGDDGSSYRLDKAADTSNAAGSVLPPPKAEEALGSGFVFDPAGYVLTNNHVIAGASSITVTFQDGTILPATVVGRDKDGDLAVLKVQAGHRLAAVPFGDSSRLRVGDWVMAVGNPFGLAGSTSAGIVSALDRNINEGKYDDFIQTDATINRGNSGGPLFDLSGHVIGVDAAIYSPSGGSVGIGFAIPAAMAAPVAAELMQAGTMRRGWLGVATQEVTPAISKVFGLSGTTGALIGGISPHGPADGTLQAGDNLVSLAGVPINDPRGLMIRTAEIPAGTRVPAQYWRDGSLHQASLALAMPPSGTDETQTPAPAPAPGNATLAALGMAVATTPTDAGLQILSVLPTGPAAAAGIVADDVVEQIGGAAVTTLKDLQAPLPHLAATHQPAVMLISGDAADGSDPGPRWVAVAVR